LLTGTVLKLIFLKVKLLIPSAIRMLGKDDSITTVGVIPAGGIKIIFW